MKIPVHCEKQKQNRLLNSYFKSGHTKLNVSIPANYEIHAGAHMQIIFQINFPSVLFK